MFFVRPPFPGPWRFVGATERTGLEAEVRLSVCPPAVVTEICPSLEGAGLLAGGGKFMQETIRRPMCDPK